MRLLRDFRDLVIGALMMASPANPTATGTGMLPESVFQHLPNELLTSIVSWLDRPRDLFHLSLTNKFFFEIIVPNILYFTNISCDTPSRFPAIWRILNDQPHLAKQIRALAIVPEEDYTRLKDSYYYKSRAFRINSQTWPSKLALPVPRFEPTVISMADSIRNMESLAMFSMKHSLTRHDLLDILMTLITFCPNLKALSFQLKVLRNISGLVSPPPGPIHVGSLPYLTSFSLAMTANENGDSNGFLIDLVTLHLPSLTDLSLVNKSNVCLTLQTFFQGASWPNLRRLTLTGWLMLYPLTSQNRQTRTDLSVSFFRRHPLLERFYLSESLNSRAIERATFLQSSAFPSLRSIHGSFVMSKEIVERLFHIENADNQHLSVIRSAKSLRSCSLISTDASDIETFIEQVPHLQRLSLTWFVVLDDECSIHGSFLPLLPCTCLRDRLWNSLIKLKNLTHLVLDLILDATPTYLNPLRDIAEKLPKLKYLHLRLNGVGKWTIIERGKGPSAKSITRYEVEGDSTFEEYHNGQWGNFFMNTVI